MKKNTIITAIACLAATTAVSNAAVVAGWGEAYGATTTSANIHLGVTADLETTGFGRSSAASSDDATYGSGSFAGDIFPAASTRGLITDGLQLSNGSLGTATITITDTIGKRFGLNSFHFDAGITRPNAANAWSLSVEPGSSITVGIIASGSVTNISPTGTNQADYDIDLTGLADHTLDPFSTIIFKLDFTGPGAFAGGHNMYLDNIAISGHAAPEPSSLALLGMGACVLHCSRKKSKLKK